MKTFLIILAVTFVVRIILIEGVFGFYVAKKFENDENLEQIVEENWGSAGGTLVALQNYYFQQLFGKGWKIAWVLSYIINFITIPWGYLWNIGLLLYAKWCMR